MVDVITEIDIKASLENVASYAANPDHATQWYENIKKVEWKSPKTLRVGSLVAFTAHFLGKQLSYTYEFVELIPNQKLVMRTAEGPFPMETTYTWTKIDDNTTRMTLRNRGTPRGFSNLLTPLMEVMMKRANNKDLKMIKRILESRD